MIVLLKMVQDESDFGNFFVVLEDLTLLCLQTNQHLFFQKFYSEFKQFLVFKKDLNIQFFKYCGHLLKVIISMSNDEYKEELEITVGEFLQHTLALS